MGCKSFQAKMTKFLEIEINRDEREIERRGNNETAGQRDGSMKRCIDSQIEKDAEGIKDEI